MNMVNKFNNGIDFVINKRSPIWHIEQFYRYLLLRVSEMRSIGIENECFDLEEESMDIDEKKISSPIIKEEFVILPTIVLARPLVDNFKLLRTLECR